jgi:hypothetical protein
MGKSKSNTYPYGKRRKDQEGQKLAPRSIRQNTDKHYLEQCTDKEIEKYTNMNPDDVRNPSKSTSNF